jgi:hypothetical protein
MELKSFTKDGEFTEDVKRRIEFDNTPPSVISKIEIIKALVETQMILEEEIRSLLGI